MFNNICKEINKTEVDFTNQTKLSQRPYLQLERDVIYILINLIAI